ncbi:DUF1800 domain-containing protein [Flavobacterium sp.]|uniref:DUF1800 domain-containing protein n=1 Tax=Flavobacterium sp. TaxID=239 RepID=UPI00286DD18B|nr:DUF1800 domain-containing protein [Flavobacterium sp.]
MNNNTLWSLRLGFSNKQEKVIEKSGIAKFLEDSFNSKFDTSIPDFLKDSPKSLEEFKAIRKNRKEATEEEKKQFLKKEISTSLEMKGWWIDKMITNDLPLLEKMTCFWHNHYVSTYQKVKVNYWIFQHNQILRENAFGNFKDLTKKMIKSNAMVRYLDNTDNRKGKLNENLSRELLELFTLGIGNYTENDIKNGAKGLAGLGIGDENAIYRKIFEDPEPFDYLGKNGSFKIEEMIDIIFEQKNIPYLLTRKILKWFIYDNPSEDLVNYYGDYFRKVDFEIKPLLTRIFTEEFAKNTAGSKIKNPIEYTLQLVDELNNKTIKSKLISIFIKQQGMDLFNQPNVKGWDGGNNWLTSQIYLQRNNAADLLCSGKNLNRAKKAENDSEMMSENQENSSKLDLKWSKNGNNKTIISELKKRLLFQVDEATQKDFEAILKYDFNPEAQNADQAVLRLFNAMVKLPEYQLI